MGWICPLPQWSRSEARPLKNDADAVVTDWTSRPMNKIYT